MNIWLLADGEPVPSDGENERLLRTGLLAEALLQRGHNVIWWSSTFYHQKKLLRSKNNTEVKVSTGYTLKLIHCTPYKRNVSLKRIFHHKQLGDRFYRWAVNEKKPDIIFASLPVIELALVATRFGNENNIPVVLDLRDKWPDIFLELFPKSIHFIVKTAIQPLKLKVGVACKKATSLVGITKEFLDWGLFYADRKSSASDIVFPIAYREKKPSNDNIKKAMLFWKNHGVEHQADNFIICFFGTLGRHFDIETVLSAAKKLKSDKEDHFIFVICGTGEFESKYKNIAQGDKNIIMPGRIGEAEIWTLLRMSSAGLSPYINSDNFRCNISNKNIEYLSAGLPVITSVTGALKVLITENECGFCYQNGKPESLVKILEHLYDNKLVLKRMEENARKVFQARYVAENVYKSMSLYLEKIFAEK